MKLIKIIIARIIEQLFRDRNKMEFMVFLLYICLIRSTNVGYSVQVRIGLRQQRW